MKSARVRTEVIQEGVIEIEENGEIIRYPFSREGSDLKLGDELKVRVVGNRAYPAGDLLWLSRTFNLLFAAIILCGIFYWI